MNFVDFLGSGGLPVAQPQPLYEPFYMKPNVLAGFIREISFLNIHLGPLLNKYIIFDRFNKAFYSVPLLGKKSMFSTGFIRVFHFFGDLFGFPYGWHSSFSICFIGCLRNLVSVGISSRPRNHCFQQVL